MQRKITITFFLAMLVGPVGATIGVGQDSPPSFPSVFSNPGICFPTGLHSGPIEVVTDDVITNELELEIAVRPAKLGVPAKVMLNGFVTNKGTEPFDVLDFTTSNDIAVYCNTSSESDQPASVSRMDSLYPNSWILQKKEKDDSRPMIESTIFVKKFLFG